MRRYQEKYHIKKTAKSKVECVYDREKYEYTLSNENNGVF